ncbi:MAG: alpha/beta fold hydrolase [Aeromonadales bacterium]|nr:alpha/beta fold hydrolase [Aeromonadales bacterium]MDY2891365.1 alpha/beta fold hydrolase [Succinivibrio sp.]
MSDGRGGTGAGRKLGFLAAGPSSGRPLAVTHGWAADSSFTSCISALFPKRRVLLIDMPGYGRSADLADAAPDFDRTLSLLAATLPDGCDLMCWSLSSLFGIALCARGMLDGRLVTVCGSPRIPDEPGNPGLKERYVRKLLEALTPRSAPHLIGLFYAAQRRGLGGEHIAACFKSFKLPPYSVLKAGVDIMAAADERVDFMRMRNRALHLFGRHDLLVPPAQSGIMAKRHGSACHVLENSAHMPFITEPQAFAKAVDSFLIY